MRRTFLLFTVTLIVGVAARADAKALPWNGTLVLDLGTLESVVLTGTGVATVNDSSGNDHLNTLRIAGGIAGTGLIPVTDPDTTVTIKSIRVSATLGSGTISGISGAPPVANGRLPVAGFVRICLFFTGCTTSLNLKMTENDGNTGFGVGGLLTIGRYGAQRFSIYGAPWTLGSGMGINQTAKGGFRTVTATGFVHGPASLGSSTAKASGLIQLISPMSVLTFGVPGNSEILTLFGRLTFHFIPEPGLLLLLGSGVLGLALVGRNRTRS